MLRDGFRAPTEPPVVAIAGVAAVAGHIFPVWLGFKAGKRRRHGVGCVSRDCSIAVGCASIVVSSCCCDVTVRFAGLDAGGGFDARLGRDLVPR